MSIVKSVRVATDFSEPAGWAVDRAASVIRAAGLDHGSLVHALDSHRVRAVRDLLPVLAGLERDLTESAEKSLTKDVARVEQATGVKLAPKMVEGDVAGALLQEAGADDLLVIGAKGATNARDVILGSTAEKVVRRSDSPVLVVRNKVAGDYARLVVAMDFSEDSKAALRFAAAVAPAARIYLVHAFMPLPRTPQIQAPISEEDIARYDEAVKKQAAERMDAVIRECGVDEDRVEPVMDYGNAPLVIREKAQAVDAELIVVGRHGEHKFKDWLLGSVTNNILNSSSRDVLVVKA